MEFPIFRYFVVLIFCFSLHQVKGRTSRIRINGPGVTTTDKFFVFEYGNPELFVTSDTQNFDPYRWIDKRKLTSIENEYILYSDDDENDDHEFKMLLMIYDPTADDIVRQNL